MVPRHTSKLGRRFRDAPRVSSRPRLGVGAHDFSGAGELAARLAGSRALSECFARQVYRYALGQVERPGEDLGWLTAAASPDARLTDFLLTIVDSSAFDRRAFE